MKIYCQSAFVGLLLLISNSAIAKCNIHDHNCSFHSIGSQNNHSGSQSVHHIRGIQTTPYIPNTANGLYGVAEWANNSNELSADVDIEGLLPDNAGAYVISDTSVFGRSPPSSSPFAGMPNASNRSVDTFRYQTTFQNNTATAIHSVDTNGSAPIPNPQPCIAAGQSDSCEHIQIKGNVPTGTYEFAVTNYDVFHLADPSTPEVKLYAGIIRGDPNSADYVSGEIVYNNQAGEIRGSLPNRGDRLPHLQVGFINHDFKPHAEGVVLDTYQTIKNAGRLIYADPYTVKKGNKLITYQKTYRDKVQVQYQDIIGANGKRIGKPLEVRRGKVVKNVFVGKNFVSKKTIPVPKKKTNPLFDYPSPFTVGYNSNLGATLPAYSYSGIGLYPSAKSQKQYRLLDGSISKYEDLDFTHKAIVNTGEFLEEYIDDIERGANIATNITTLGLTNNLASNASDNIRVSSYEIVNVWIDPTLSQQHLASKIWQTGGKTVQGIFAVPNTAVSDVSNTVGVSTVLSYVNDRYSETSLGQWTEKQSKDFTRNNPEFSRNIQASFDVADVLSVTKITKVNKNKKRTIASQSKVSSKKMVNRIDVWNYSPTTRGVIIESILSKTEYKNDWNIGQEFGGSFPTFDFKRGNQLISLKTVDTHTGSWLNKMQEHIKEIRDTDITSIGEIATYKLDIRVKKGQLGDALPLVEFGKANGVPVEIKEF